MYILNCNFIFWSFLLRSVYESGLITQCTEHEENTGAAAGGVCERRCCEILATIIDQNPFGCINVFH